MSGTWRGLVWFQTSQKNCGLAAQTGVRFFNRARGVASQTPEVESSCGSYFLSGPGHCGFLAEGKSRHVERCAGAIHKDSGDANAAAFSNSSAHMVQRRNSARARPGRD